MLKAAIFLTAYNESSMIGSVLEKINKSYDIYVIDDGSTDTTPEICRNKGVNVISHIINLGQGNAVVTMFKLACLLDYDIILHLDADGQHDPAEIPIFIKKFEETNVDVVQGSRILGKNYKNAPFARKLFLKPLTYLLNKMTGYNMSDSMCGYRGFRVEALKKISFLFNEMSESEYLASEMWIKFSKYGLRITDVPIQMSERKYGISYKGLFRYGWGVITAIIRAKLDVYKNKQNKLIISNRKDE